MEGSKEAGVCRGWEGEGAGQGEWRRAARHTKARHAPHTQERPATVEARRPHCSPRPHLVPSTARKATGRARVQPIEPVRAYLEGDVVGDHVQRGTARQLGGNLGNGEAGGLGGQGRGAAAAGQGQQAGRSGELVQQRGAAAGAAGAPLPASSQPSPPLFRVPHPAAPRYVSAPTHLTRGFISMMTMSPLAGLMAICRAGEAQRRAAGFAAALAVGRHCG